MERRKDLCLPDQTNHLESFPPVLSPVVKGRHHLLHVLRPPVGRADPGVEDGVDEGVKGGRGRAEGVHDQTQEGVVQGLER